VKVPTRVLVVDDETPILELVRGYLEREGWQVDEAADGSSAVELARAQAPDVVVLDVMLPGIDGFEVLRRIRSFSDAYVLLLTSRSEEIDRIIGLTAGADDYLVKPFSPRELVARIQALLRRPRVSAREQPQAIAHGDLTIDRPRRSVTLRGVPVTLTSTEFNFLATLASEPGIVFSRQQLLDRVWGMEYVGDEHVVDVHLGNLRRKLGESATDPRFVETVRSVGFRFREGP
jgi:DNA-binding response OmpR family regulator